MATLSFAFNEDTLNTTIEVLDESLDVNTAILKISYLKSSDDEDYYEFDIDEKECVISDLKFIKTSDNCYEIQFGAKIEISDEKWDGADKKFKENAQEGHIEVEFDLECDGEVFECWDSFEKHIDGVTELFID